MNPIFIGGCDRSGTTMLGAMLGAHPRCVCTPESQFLADLVARLPAAPHRIDPACALAILQRHWRFRLWGMGHLPPDAFGTAPCPLDVFIGRVIRAYAAKVEKPAHDTWVDHTPSNIRRLDRLFSIFPGAVCVHIVRDARAVAASVMPLDWGPNTVFFAARWWARQVSPGLAAERYFGPEKVLRVRYEDLLAAPETMLKKVCRFAGIEYVDAMRAATGFRVPQYTAAQHRRLKAGHIEPGRSNGWRKVLAPKQIALLEYAAGDLLTYLGYRMDNTWPAAPTPAALAAMGLEEALRWTTNRVRRWVRKRRHLRP